MSSSLSKGNMKLGVFDSGLGGLVIARSIREAMPDLDMVYLGDTLHVPYGSRSTEAIYQHSLASIRFLFDQGCPLVIVACNTASAAALRRIQQEFLVREYPDKRVLGVVVPTLETALDEGYAHLGLIATNYIVRSGIYAEELQKLKPSMKIVQQASPLLVPLIENAGEPWMDSVLESYLEPLLDQGIDSLLLGCTHYPHAKDRVRRIVGDDVAVLSQDEIVPAKLTDYLDRHPEIDALLGRSGEEVFYLSDITDTYRDASKAIYGYPIEFQKCELG